MLLIFFVLYIGATVAPFLSSPEFHIPAAQVQGAYTERGLPLREFLPDLLQSVYLPPRNFHMHFRLESLLHILQTLKVLWIPEIL